MGTAKVHNGQAIVAYIGDKAIDSEGNVIKGAPKPPKDTSPDEQPGAHGILTPEQRMGLAIAQALKGELPTQGKGKVSEDAATRDDETGDEVEATDAAQKLADENKIDLASVTGSGKDGRVTVDDVKAAIAERDGSGGE